VSAFWEIVPLAKNHERRNFSCGEPELDEYLKRFAGQHARPGIDFSRTFVAVPKDDRDRILGFYTLSMAQVEYTELPEVVRKKLPRNYPIPAARIGRLAVDSKAQGKRIGSSLLANALARCAATSRDVAAAGIVVDAKHEQAKAFYMKYGFTAFTEKPLTLFIPMRAVLESIPSD